MASRLKVDLLRPSPTSAQFDDEALIVRTGHVHPMSAVNSRV